MQPKPFVRPPIVSNLELSELEPGLHRRRLVMTENATGNETLIPVFVARAREEGPVLGVTAVIHGNELNGIQVVHNLVRAVEEIGLIAGTVIAVPIVNVPGYLREQREYEDGKDLNRIMPGKPNGNESELYAYRILDRIVRHCTHLVDLHTASFGRANSLYVRADMKSPIPAQLARLVSPQIILHSQGDDRTLRAASATIGVHAITIEIGDPQRLQPGLVHSTRLGIQEILEGLGMLPKTSEARGNSVIECARSMWMYTDRGGILEVFPDMVDRVSKGQCLARLRNIWGDLVREYEAPADGVIIGKSTNPVARAGSRILHLGIEA